jgi:hypothetical protein
MSMRSIGALLPKNFRSFGGTIMATSVISIALFTTGSAPFAQTRTATPAEAVRYAAIHKCVLEAQQQYPGGEETQNNRYFWYLSCMQKAGQLP